MAYFRESVEVLKEAGFAESEIIDIMSDSVDRQMNGPLSILKTNSNNFSNKSGHNLPNEDININVVTSTVCKR